MASLIQTFELNQTKNSYNSNSYFNVETTITSSYPSENSNRIHHHSESLSKEIVALREQVGELQEKQDILEAEKEGLVNQVGDLRVLLKRVAKEGEKSLRRAEERNSKLQEKAVSLENSLRVSRENGSYFDNLYCYWEMLE